MDDTSLFIFYPKSEPFARKSAKKEAQIFVQRKREKADGAFALFHQKACKQEENRCGKHCGKCGIVKK